MKPIRVAAFGAWFFAWPVVSAAQLTYALPKGARDVEHSALQPKVREQVAFWIQEGFPSTSAVQHYERVFAGWTPCQKDGDTDWYSFPDARDGHQTFVHELARFWVSPNNGTAISLFLRYESQREPSGGKPDNSRQVVYLVQHRSTNARKQLSEVGVTCDKGT